MCDQAAMTAALHAVGAEVGCRYREWWAQPPYRRLMASLCSLTAACWRLPCCSAALSAQACSHTMLLSQTLRKGSSLPSQLACGRACLVQNMLLVSEQHVRHKRRSR